jgi:hypothetical protein
MVDHSSNAMDCRCSWLVRALHRAAGRSGCEQHGDQALVEWCRCNKLVTVIASWIMIKPRDVNDVLSLTYKVVGGILFLIFLPSILNEAKWVLAGKSFACKKIYAEHEELVESSAGLNQRAFSSIDGTAINQAFLGTVLASAVQAPNAKLIQATILGCPTQDFTLQTTEW